MNFFLHQNTAKKITFWLIILYCIGLVIFACITIVIIDIILGSGVHTTNTGIPFSMSYFDLREIFISPRFGYILLGFAVFLLCTSQYKYFTLRTGGKTIAESLGAKLVLSQTINVHERRLINIVEEMALASGVPVPPVYVLENEPGINAFAAGFTINDAVIGVTKGTIEHLNRDELQAVIAHEFSHIFNGDMRLNLRFTALLFGLFCVSEVARMVMHSAAHSSRSRDKNSGQAQVIFLLIALVLFTAGSITALWARVIQAAINRQREYLADASAVQFTRSTGIASALKKIGASSMGSKISAPAATSYSHFFFCQIGGNLLSTHPPLKKRILRVDPQWDGTYPKLEEPENFVATQKENEQFAFDKKLVTAVFGATAAITTTPSFDATALLHAQPKNAQEALEKLKAACHEPLDACYIVFAFLLDPRAEIQQKQLATISKINFLQSYDEAMRFIPVQEHLPLIETAIPTLKTLSPSQYQTFVKTLQVFINADGIVSLKEWLIYQLILHQVGAHYVKKVEYTPRFTHIKQVHDSVAVLLSAVAELAPREHKEHAFSVGAKALLLPNITMQTNMPHTILTESLLMLQQSSELVRETFLQGVFKAISADQKIDAEEAMLLRVLSLCLDSPVQLEGNA